jgi:hypothetical protein
MSQPTLGCAIRELGLDGNADKPLGLMLELDLIGHKITLSDSDTRLILDAAKQASGSSIGSRDLATRLRELDDSASLTRRRLVFSRSESRALQRMIRTQLEPTDELRDLRLTLSDLLVNE